MFLKKLSTALFLVAALVSGASAATINWTLSGLTFSDGGLGSGTFSTDSSTGALVSWDITTTGGTALPGFHYDATSSSKYADNFFTTNSFLITRNSPFANPYLNLTFQNSLAIAGVNVLKTGDHTVGGSWECNNCVSTRTVTGGFASVSAVPEPETYALMLVGLGLVGTIARRRKQALAA